MMESRFKKLQSNPDLRDSSVTDEKSLIPSFLLNRVLQKRLINIGFYSSKRVLTLEFRINVAPRLLFLRQISQQNALL